jgi:membrane-associated phospholipid phosphatase
MLVAADTIRCARLCPAGATNLHVPEPADGDSAGSKTASEPISSGTSYLTEHSAPDRPREPGLDNGADFRRLARNTLAALLVCAALVLVCYWFVDRPVAYYVHDRGFAHDAFFKWLTYPPPVLQAWVPVLLAALVVRRVWGPLGRWERAVAAACVSLVLADQFRETLAYVFGRYWPETWVDNNPSLIRDGAYGFHPFHSGPAYGSFPSGHTARTLAAAAVVWIAYPRWRWACGLASVAVAAGLLGMDYHFVGDVIAGGFVGGIVGAYTAHFTGLGEPRHPAPHPAAPPNNGVSQYRRP